VTGSIGGFNSQMALDLTGLDRTRTKPRKRRAEAEIRSGVDPFDYLCQRLGEYTRVRDHANAERLCLELMPYCKPKLRTVDLNMSASRPTPSHVPARACV